MAGGSGLTQFGDGAAPAEPPRGQVLPAGRDPRLRRRKRQAWTFVALFSLVLLAGLVATGQWLRWWEIGGPSARAAAAPCPEQTTTTPRTVTVNVYNGTTTFGLARSVAVELQGRGFRVATITNDDTGTVVKGVAVVRHGPPGLRSAVTLAKQINGEVTLVDDGRDTRTVDIVVGPAYRAMIPRPDASKAIAAVPTPEGCVPVTTPATTPPAPPPTS